MRPPTDQEVTDALIGKDRRRILDAKAEAERQHHEWQRVKAAQRDPDEKYRPNRHQAGPGRAGY
jgi:hypothetical protein